MREGALDGLGQSFRGLVLVAVQLEAREPRENRVPRRLQSLARKDYYNSLTVSQTHTHTRQRFHRETQLCEETRQARAAVPRAASSSSQAATRAVASRRMPARCLFPRRTSQCRSVFGHLRKFPPRSRHREFGAVHDVQRR